jgi:hypothetical protein
MSGPKRAELLQKFGHAGGHLRECLGDALDYQADWWQHLEMDFLQERHQRWWDHAPALQRAYWLIGQLWHYTDTVPSLLRGSVQDWLEEEYFSYAQLVRVLKEDLDARSTKDQLAS